MKRLLAICAALAAAAATSAPEPLLVGYLGGSGTDDCDGITLDRAGDIYLGCIELEHEDIAPRPGELTLDGIGGGWKIGRLRLAQHVYRSILRHLQIACGIPV